MQRLLVSGLVLLIAPFAFGEIVITEWMYNGSGDGNAGEYVEFTNVGAEAIDMTGWSYDDSSRIAGTIDLSGFGIVQPGQSVILTDETAETFSTAWGLTGISIVGECTANLGRNDEINLYDASSTLVDRLTYGDEDFPGTVRTQTRSCSIPDTDYAYTESQTTWVLASLGDDFGSLESTRGEIGNPGRITGFPDRDFDNDGDVDLSDATALIYCITGPFVSYDPLPGSCSMTPDGDGVIGADLDEDGDVDLEDFGIFQPCFSGEDVPADATCIGSVDTPGDTVITLNGTSITVEGSGVVVDGTTATITAEGTYTVSGSLSDGQLVVNSPDAGAVVLILNGVNISNSTSAPIFVLAAEEISVVLADGTTNVLTDATTYIYDDPEENDPNAALHSKDTMTISGNGSLTVYANYNDAITSKDELIITGGTFNVTAVDDGIRGKDYLQIEGGTFTVNAGGDAIKSDNEDDVELGYITISGGTFDITAGGDGLAAETDVTITDGDFEIQTAGGAGAYISDDLSAKAIKGQASVLIEGGTFDIDSADDAVHSNDVVTINGGDFTIATGDDGFHSDTTLTVNDGTILVTESYEGIEGADVVLNGGTIEVHSSDDGINGAGGNDGSGGPFPWPPPSGGDYSIQIHGGFIAVYAEGDGIDVNGDLTMTAGTVLVHGPTYSMNGPLDYDGTFNMNGGFLIAAGTSSMAQAPSNSSSQRSVKITYQQWQAAGTIVNLQTTSGGSNIATFSPSKQYQSVVISSPDLVYGTSYRLYSGGSSTGTFTNGLYEDGSYSPGTLKTTFTVYNTVTNVYTQ